MSRRLAASLSSQWAATLYGAGAALFLSFALGRALGPAVFGDYAYVLTLASLFAIVQDGGFSTLLFRETARAAADPVGEARLAAVSLGHMLAATSLGLGLVLLTQLGHTAALAWAVAYYALFTLAAYASAMHKGRGAFAAEAAYRAGQRTLTVACALLALLLPNPDPATIFVALFIGQALALFLPQARPILVRPRLAGSMVEYRAPLAFLLISAATAIYFRCDIILLKHLQSDAAEVGEYAAAYRLIEGAVMLATPLSHIFFRTLRLKLDDLAGFRRTLTRMLLVMTGLALSGAAVSFFIGPWVLTLAFGPKFEPAGPLMRLLSLCLVFILPNALLTQTLVALGRERYYAVATVFTAALNIGLNALFIPRYAGHGAAAATIVTEGVLSLALAWSFFRQGCRPSGTCPAD